jgi:hypothetical protein
MTLVIISISGVLATMAAESVPLRSSHKQQHKFVSFVHERLKKFPLRYLSTSTSFPFDTGLLLELTCDRRQ